jgi:hypothetical protein
MSAAQWVYTTIAKMDDGEAEVFVAMLVSELHSWDLAANERMLKQADDRKTDLVAKHLLDRLNSGDDPEEVLAMAASVAIAKDADAWRYQDRDQLGRWGHMSRREYKAQVKELKARQGVEQAQVRSELKRARQLRSGGAYNTAQRTGPAANSMASNFEQSHNRRPNQAQSGVTESFRRLENGGHLIQSIGVGANRPAVALAGATARYVGQFGPEAEKVIGPHLRRTTYRYRGTERRPDPAVNRLAQGEAIGVLRAEGRDGAINSQTVRLANGHTKTVSTRNESPMAALDDQQRVYATEQAAVSYFLGDKKDDRPSRIPKASRAELQRKSGKITPSEGILIDSTGKVAAQAVGYGEDHYLPFNLKNLGALKGGSYVRTRESGGLTTEDVYAGLMSGARAVTVVSNSGVFVLEFDDTLRGGRRYNDKAKQMVAQYGSTLDAIKSEQIKNPERQLKPADRARLKVQIARRVNDNPDFKLFTSSEKDKIVENQYAAELLKPQLSPEQRKSLLREASEGARDKQEADYIFRQLEEEALENKASSNYRLDGEGYAAAMDALKEQFPYYIGDVRYETKDRAQSSYGGLFNSSIDHGYVKPKFIRPEGALSGYYDSSITGTDKTPADRTLYQNFRVSGQRETATPVPSSHGGDQIKAPNNTEMPEQKATAEAAARNAKREEESRFAEGVGQDAAAWYAIHRQDEEGLGSGLDAEFENLHDFFRATSADDRKRFLSDPTKVQALVREMDQADKRYFAEDPQNRPKNRQFYKQKMARGDLTDENLKGDVSPISPLKMTSQANDELIRNPAMAQNVGALTAKDDSELKAVSDQLRAALRRHVEAEEPEEVKRHAEMIKQVEMARARKAEAPPEYDAEEFQRKLADKVQPKQAVAKPNETGNKGPLNEALIKISRAYGKGMYTLDEAKSEAKQAYDAIADDLSEPERTNQVHHFVEFIRDHYQQS